MNAKPSTVGVLVRVDFELCSGFNRYNTTKMHQGVGHYYLAGSAEPREPQNDTSLAFQCPPAVQITACRIIFKNKRA